MNHTGAHSAEQKLSCASDAALPSNASKSQSRPSPGFLSSSFMFRRFPNAEALGSFSLFWGYFCLYFTHHFFFFSYPGSWLQHTSFSSCGAWASLRRVGFVEACGILAPQPRIKHGPPALEAQSYNARKFPWNPFSF